jgi:phosphoribosylformylglycinamidine cyclo-ligase
MVVDDIVVVGARPLFMTDYIACGKVVPARIAAIVEGIATACAATGTALVGGETAEHPGLLGANDYDVAGAAVGVVEAELALGPEKVSHGDVVIAMGSSGLHSNGYSLVRHILAKRSLGYTDTSAELGGVIGEVLLEPTRLYTGPLVRILDDMPGVIHAMSHVTGGGIAANLARVLPLGSWVDVDRATWSPQPVFRVLAEWGDMALTDAEGTWNLGIGMFAVVDSAAASSVVRAIEAEGIPAWVAGRVTFGEPAGGDYEQGAKGVNGGAVRLVGSFAS